MRRARLFGRGHQRAPSKRPVCNYRHEAWPCGRTIGPLFISLPSHSLRRDGISDLRAFRPLCDPIYPPRNIDRLSIVDKTILGAKEFPFGRHTLSRMGLPCHHPREDLSDLKHSNIRRKCCLPPLLRISRGLQGMLREIRRFNDLMLSVLYGNKCV